MALAQVNTGSAPNAGDGDTLRAAFTTVNANMVKLAGKSGAGDPNILGIAGDYDMQPYRNTDTRGIHHWDAALGEWSA